MLAAAGQAGVNTAAKASISRKQFMGSIFAGELFHYSPAMDKLRPLEIVFDEIIKSRCRYFYMCAIRKPDRHSRLPRVLILNTC
jgi:hypothetical protein